MNNSPTEHTIEFTYADRVPVTLVRSFRRGTDDCRFERRTSKRRIGLDLKGLLNPALRTETHPLTGTIATVSTAIGEFPGSGATFHGNKSRPSV